MSHSTAEAGALSPRDPVEGRGHRQVAPLEGKTANTPRLGPVSTSRQRIAELARQALGMAVAIAWLPGPAGTRRRVAKLSVEEPDAAEPARPDLWGARVSNGPGLPDLVAPWNEEIPRRWRKRGHQVIPDDERAALCDLDPPGSCTRRESLPPMMYSDGGKYSHSPRQTSATGARAVTPNRCTGVSQSSRRRYRLAMMTQRTTLTRSSRSNRYSSSAAKHNATVDEIAMLMTTAQKVRSSGRNSDRRQRS